MCFKENKTYTERSHTNKTNMSATPVWNIEHLFRSAHIRKQYDFV